MIGKNIRYASRDHDEVAEFYDWGMAERNLGKTFIRQWRLKRKLSLRQLANRMEKEPGGELIVSHASISRIEKGQQPYSQEILEALAEALQVSKGALLEINPEKEGEVIDLVRRLDEAKRAQAMDYLRFLAGI
jgi:transcriptional regulator with XRE-family HTH domain